MDSKEDDTRISIQEGTELTTRTGLTINDVTDLTKLIGSEQRYKPLVEKCFTDEDCGNLTWGDAKQLTLKAFIDGYGGNILNRTNKLRGWVAHCGLEDHFKPEEQQENGEHFGFGSFVYC